MTRALAHGDFVVEVAAWKGVKISMYGSGLMECMASFLFHDILVEASRKLRIWEKIWPLWRRQSSAAFRWVLPERL